MINRNKQAARIAAALVGVGLAATALTGCSSGSSAATSSHTLSVGINGTIATWNPWKAPTGAESKAMSFVYDSLLHQSSTGTVEPALATKWSRPNPQTVDLTLRSDAKFSDGTPFNGAAVKANFAYAQKVSTPGQCNGYLTGLTTTVNSATSVTLHLSSSNPDPDILLDISGCAGWMVSPKALANDSSLTQTPDGTGPYVLNSAGTTVGQQWSFKRAKGYWDNSQYPFNTAKIIFYSDPTAAANAARTGALDLIQGVDPKTDSSGLSYVQSAPNQFRGLYISDVEGTISKPLGNVKVREAMQYAINRKEIASQLYPKGTADAVGYAPFVPGSIGYSTALNNSYSYNPTKAKQLLAEAGYPNGFTVDVLNDPVNLGNLSTVIAQDEQAIGITLNLKDHSPDFVSQLTSGTWPIVAGNYTQGLSVYHTMQGMIEPNGAFFNPLKNSNPQFTSLLKQITETTNAATEKSLYQKLGLAISNQGWFLAPVQIAATVAYNHKTISASLVPGNSQVWLYDIGLPKK